jgi:transposase
MWEFRRNPQGLSAEEKAKLEGLFAKLPQLRTLYEIRVRFQEIFDTAPDRRKALRSLTGLWLDLLDHFPGMEPFICTFERWQEEILNYFEGRQTSGPVEGINNKARVIVKRAYGLKSADSLWSRLILDQAIHGGITGGFAPSFWFAGPPSPRRVVGRLRDADYHL